MTHQRQLRIEAFREHAVDNGSMPTAERGSGDGEQEIGRRIDAVHRGLQLHLAEDCPREDPLVLICALGYEIVRVVRTLEPTWTPKALDRFLVDFTRLLRRYVLDH
jgi:hypothetical protein